MILDFQFPKERWSEKSELNNSWLETSTISLNNNEKDPKKLCFVLLNGEDFSVNTVWLFKVQELIDSNRIKTNTKKSYLRIQLTNDFDNMIYPYRRKNNGWEYIGTNNDQCIYLRKSNKKYQVLPISERCS